MRVKLISLDESGVWPSVLTFCKKKFICVRFNTFKISLQLTNWPINSFTKDKKTSSSMPCNLSTMWHRKENLIVRIYQRKKRVSTRDTHAN